MDSTVPTKFLFYKFLETVIYEHNAIHSEPEEKGGKGLWAQLKKADTWKNHKYLYFVMRLS